MLYSYCLQDLCLSWILNSVVSWKGCFRFSVSVWRPRWTVQVLLFLKGVSVTDLIGGLHFVIFNLSTVLCPRTLPQEPLAEVIFSPFLLHYIGVRCQMELRWAKLRCHSSWLFLCLCADEEMWKTSRCSCQFSF